MGKGFFTFDLVNFSYQNFCLLGHLDPCQCGDLDGRLAHDLGIDRIGFEIEQDAA